MFYKIIKKKRDEWLTSPSCTINSLIEYIEQRGVMRDAQREAIKTYLYLKIACGNKPLAELFKQGYFNSLTPTEIDELPLSANARQVFQSSPAAIALYEFASSKDDDGNAIAEKLAQSILNNPSAIDYEKVFDTLFYGVSYPDYVFSLPMGAGKTYLMAAFIYLDLYFAQQEPDNKAFAHNFMVFAPSGTKTSIIPSLRTIQDFDPSWIIPEPAASKLKKQLKFEMLDEDKSANKSNRTKNPNVQKIAIHEPLCDLFGLVAVTNAEKVILDRVDMDMNPNLFEEKELAMIKSANELREKIASIPNLSILIDEVHHVASKNDGDEAKLRKVVNGWTDKGTITTVLGFSGTPYLDKKETISFTDTQSIKTSEMSNIVDYYPLVNGIGNFLKVPAVFKSDSNVRGEIVENGIRKFFDSYKNITYQNGTCAKLGIYCGSIKNLEEEIYPIASKVCNEYGLNPQDAILKFHEGNKEYPEPQNARSEFAVLDKPFSKKRIVLLVQIGKEGWDCKSLTGIILSQEGDCSKNMVLQTSCRCLREVTDAKSESAIIYLNEQNYRYLDEQLRKQHHISLDEFQKSKKKNETISLNRYDRTEHLNLPPIEFYQLHVKYEDEISQSATSDSIKSEIATAKESAKIENAIETEWKITKSGFECVTTYVDDTEHGKLNANFNQWLYEIAKESFGNITMSDLNSYSTELKNIFEAITFTNDAGRFFSSHYDVAKVNANIRKAFYDKRTLKVSDELIDQKAELLHVTNFQTFSPIEIAENDKDKFYPDSQKVENIIKEDNGEFLMDEKTIKTIQSLEDIGQHEMADNLRRQKSSDVNRDKSYHYIPYRIDSNFESDFLAKVLTLNSVQQKNLEVYYNGDGQFTEFRILCYKQNEKKQWGYIGQYTPDFLIIKRKDNEIHKALIVETKGEIYATDEIFKKKKSFVESEFLKANNDKFGYERFDYLYLEDSLSDAERINKTNDLINQFFND